MKKIALSLIAALISLNVWAASSEAEKEAAWIAAVNAADKVTIHGPAKTTVAGQSEITIPKGYNFVPAKEAAALMSAMGNGTDPNLQGLLVPAEDRDAAAGFYTIDFTKDGYIEDDDAKDLDADEILKQYKEATEIGNKERIKNGFQPFEVIDWAQKPAYDEKLHRLTWALTLRDKGATNTMDDTVNYETRILGREGVLSMTWVADLDQLNAGKTNADSLTAGVQYVDGKKYENYSASAGDKVAEYGLAALITGVAAKKLGLLALIGVFLAKFAKIGLIALFAAFPLLRRLFKKNDKPEITPPVFNDTPPNDPLSNPQPATKAQISAATTAAQQDELTDTTKL